ncbi:MAG: MotA/TolQ/ExbB proton channel family protein [Spirochaetaceae bacterium]|nr:MAG: MotA/TolQ/ExbB proton channel family protein [Spirochaetaceae bacterium]
MFELINKGGIIMWFICPLSLVAFAIIIERLIYFWKIRTDEDKMINRLKITMEKKHYDEALAICESNPSPITNLLKVGLEHKQYGPQAIKDAITDAANQEIPKLEKNLSFLGTIANIAPLLGLLGTVVGNISAFDVLNNMEGLNTSRLSGDIAVALLTTAAGIIVALPAIIFYNYLVAKVNHIIIRLENRVNQMVLLFTEGK